MASRWKRDTVNAKNIVEFFGEKGFNPFDFVSPEAFLQLVQLCERQPGVVDHIQSYARRFKQATRELTPEVIGEASDIMTVKKVMES